MVFNLNQKISTPLAISIIVILAAILVGGIFIYQYRLPKEEITETDETANWKTYRNEELGIEFKYPSNWENLFLTREKNDILDWPGNVFTYQDPQNIFYFFIYSEDFIPFELTILNNQSVDVNWTLAEFAVNMELSEEDVLLIKKLSEKSILVAFYEAPEWSPMLHLSVLRPLKNKNYPNFEIRVSSPFYLPENFYFPENVEEYSYVRNFYKDIAEKIGDGTYSESIKLDIETARLIVDSVEENEINQNKIAP